MVFDYVKQRRERRETADFLAMQVAFALEEYGLKCLDAAGVQEFAIETEGAMGEYLDAIPQLPPYPESSAFKMMDRAIVHDVFAFPHRVLMAQQAVDFHRTALRDPKRHANALLQNTHRLSVAAMHLAERIRRAHRLPRRKLSVGELDSDDVPGATPPDAPTRE